MAEARKSGWRVGRRSVLALAGMCLFAGCAQWASAGPSLVDLSVVDRESGQVLQIYQQGDRLFVAGTPGARYSLRVSNRTNARVMVVVSVDGINIINGQTANYLQTGYVLDAWRSYDLTGWRKSDTEIAAFEFSSLGRSYAARTGRPGNVGVIGMAVFQEKVVPQPPAVLPSPSISGRSESRDSSLAGADASKATAGAPSSNVAAAPEASAQARMDADSAAGMGARPERRAQEMEEARRGASVQPLDKLGTAHGQREWAVSTRTAFDRATLRPVSVRTIEYDQYENLVAMGVIPSYGVGRRPTPFPAQAGYVPDPPPGR